MTATEPPIETRAARPADAPAIAALYNHGIRERTATFETRERDVAEVEAWFAEARPFVVLTIGDEVVGFARAARYSPRSAYDGVGEHAVYVDPAHRGRRLARTLLDALADSGRAAGLHKLCGLVFVDNAASRRAHAASGFTEIGIHRRHARLDGEWKDCVIVERLLGAADPVPRRPAP